MFGYKLNLNQHYYPSLIHHLCRFPFDNQTCELKFASTEFKSSELQFQTFANVSNNVLNREMEDNEWEIYIENDKVANISQITIKGQSIEESEQSTYIFSCALSRRPFYAIVNLIVPTVLISV